MRGEPYTPCVLNALSWQGPPPVDGAFLVTPAGSAYRIEHVTERPSGSYLLDCTRWPLAEIPGDALTFEWHWSKRLPRRMQAGQVKW